MDCDISSPEGLEKALDDELFQRRCPRFVKDAVQIAEELIGDEEKPRDSFTAETDGLIVFKGGTALRKLFAGVEGRFSTDFDFALYDKEEDASEVADV